MKTNPRQYPNVKIAQNLIQKTLEIISRVLVFLGKPFYVILIAPILFSVFIFKIIRYILKFLNLRKQSIQKTLPKKATVFSSSWYRLKILMLFLKRKIYNLQVRLEKAYWNTQVFALAVEKFSLKILTLIYDKAKESLFIKKVETVPTRLRLQVLSLILFNQKLKTKLKIYLAPRFKLTLYLAIFFFLCATSATIFLWELVLKDLPSPSSLKERKFPVSTKIYDRNGILLFTFFKEQKRTPVSLKDIPPQVKLATIAIEDAEFYSHPGFSIKGITRAIIRNLRRGELSGGSTITQQLVKNTLLTPEKTISRKIKEIILAIQVELSFSKDEILEMYLNEVSYGGTAYGIQEAARTYFDKDVNELTLAEAALLAGLPKSPTKYSPFGQNPESAKERQKEVLRRMYENGFITEEQRRKAESETLKFAPKTVPIKAPHFVFFVKEELEKKYGPEVVEMGGLEVITTLDLRIQSLTEEVLKEELNKLKNLNVKNGGVIVLNPKTGQILAMVGSKDFFDTSIDGNVNVTTSPRQPGSSIKVVNYAYALSHGFTPATIIPDTPVTFYVEGQPPYTPRNYEGGFRGNLTLRNALAESRNIPAVRVLATYGVKNMVEMGKKMGITTWEDPKNYGLSLTLGGGEVKLIDLATVYATIANYGKRPEIRSIIKISNYKGKVLEEFNCKEDNPPLVAETLATSSGFKNILGDKNDCGGEQVIDPRVSFLITDILKDNQARAPAFGANSLLVIPDHKEVAVKTGTSNELRDNLAIGYTQNYVVAVWVGNNDNSPMARIASGVTGATPIFNKIMTMLLKDSPSQDWPIPPRIIQLPICPFTGTLACEGCPVKMEWFLEENKPQKACSPDWFKKEEDTNKDSENERPNTQPEQVYINNEFSSILSNKRQNKIDKKPKRN